MRLVTGESADYAREFDAIAPELSGADIPWLLELRKQAMGKFVSQGFPSTKTEDWKYTDTRPIQRFPFQLAGSESVDVESILDESHDMGDCYRVVFLNQVFVQQDSHLPDAGVRVCPLSDVLQSDPELLRSVLTDANQTPFSSLNTAMMQDGLCVLVDDGVKLDKPIHVLHLCGQKGLLASSHLRHVVVAGENSDVSVIEQYVSMKGADPSFHNVLTQIVARPHSRINHSVVQDLADDAFYVHRVDVHQSAGSRFASDSLAFGGKLARTDIHVCLAGEHAECQLLGFYFTTGSQHVDFHTSIRHAAKHCRSVERYRGILDDHSRGVFNGRVLVDEGADGTDAAQENRNLLLTGEAEIDTKPELEIYADDVKCSHGATVGRIDDDALFYLSSRGLADEHARKLLAYTFASDVLKDMSLPSVCRYAEQKVMGGLDLDLSGGSN